MADGPSVTLSSNDYLGLSRHPAVVQAAAEALAEHGVGAGSSRGAAGDVAAQERLEMDLAHFKGAESVVVFQSGLAANIGLIPALVGPGDLLVRDEWSHPSTIDGARLSGARVVEYRHADVDHLESILRQHRHDVTEGSVVVATDGVFGTMGDIAPLPWICEVAERYGADIIVDDAHGTGVLGHRGRGSVEHHGVAERVHIQVGTLSKALGVVGGFVGSSNRLRTALLARSHPINYSTQLPPALTAACVASLGVLQNETERLERLWRNTISFKERLSAIGWSGPDGGTPIVPIFLPSADLTRRFAARMRDEGVLAQAITNPTRSDSRPRLRLIIRSELTDEDLARVVDSIGRAAAKLGVGI